LRFDLGLNKVKDLLAEKVIGNTISVQAEVGQYLPDWRKGTNYKEGMSAKISLGGGVMLDLIHEFDYLSWLLGPFQTIFGLNKQSEALGIETEAISVNIFETTSGVLGTLSLDYLQKDLNRNAKFIGDFGTIIWDYPTSEVKWKTHNEQNWNTFVYAEISRNDRFKAVLQSFFNANGSNFDVRLTNLQESILSLKAVVDAKNTPKITI
jgi:predicted dehydrogenase